MKKKIFSAALIAAMAVTAGWNYQQNKQSIVLSDLAMANVEALARGEYVGGGTCYGSGANHSDVHCDGGYTICAWCHTHVYGKD